MTPTSPRNALRFRRPRLLIVGCGDVGMRVVQLLRGRWQLLALTSSPARCAELRAAGAVPLIGNLDTPATLARLHGLADAVLHLAPPAAHGASDARTANLLAALGNRDGGGKVSAPGAAQRQRHLRRLVYVSTSGVYGDCGGARIDETRTVCPATDRGRRRVDAEARVRAFGRTEGVAVALLRVPGIYALDRSGGDPRERVARGTPVLTPADDVFTNHIHADDLARACVAALYRALPQRAVHICDDTELKMGDYFDLVADLFALPRPPRAPRIADAASAAAPAWSPMQLSFMNESRRLSNVRLKRELRLRLRYPTVTQGLALAAPCLDIQPPPATDLPTR